MRIDVYIEEKDLTLEWREYFPTGKAHMVIYDDGSFSHTACKKVLQSRDFTLDPDNDGPDFGYCTTCKRSSIVRDRDL